MSKQYLRRLPFVIFFLTYLILPSIVLKADQVISPNAGGTLAWDSQGTELAVFASNGVFIYDRNSNLIRYSDLAAATGGWSIDGKELIVDSQILDAQTFTPLLNYKLPFQTWLPNLSEVLTIAKNGREIEIWDVKNGNLVKTIASPAQLEYLYPSPDGSHILAVIANSLFLFDTKQGELSGQYLVPVSSIESYIWSSDSLRIAYTSTTLVPSGTVGSISTADSKNSVIYNINILEANTGENIVTSSPLPESVFSLNWSEDGMRIAGESRSSNVYIWDANTLKQINLFSVSNEVTGRLAYSPYGGVLAVGVNPQPSSSRLSNQQLAAINALSIANNTIQLIVPEASSEKLQILTKACGMQPSIQQSLSTQIANNKLQAFTSDVSALTDTQIPLGCKLDLLAVANALMAKPQ